MRVANHRSALRADGVGTAAASRLHLDGSLQRGLKAGSLFTHLAVALSPVGSGGAVLPSRVEALSAHSGPEGRPSTVITGWLLGVSLPQ
jgi:hypothetical protein